MTDVDVEVPAVLEDLPPSGKLVGLALAGADGELTQKQIIQATKLSGRTVRDALDRLEDHDGVTLRRRHSASDARQDLYWLSV